MKNEIEKVQPSEIKSTESAPVDMIAYAIQQGAGIETIEKMWELKRRNEENEALKAFNASISDFRAECPVIKKTREAYSSKYAGLAETIEQIKPLLSKHGLSHRWKTHQNGADISVECTVAHRLGHSESTSLTAKADTSGSKNSIQAIGSTLSYLERYTLFAILGLASTDMDDDGAASEQSTVECITESQVADILAMLSELDVSEDDFLKWEGAESIEKIPVSRYERTIRKLEATRKKK